MKLEATTILTQGDPVRLNIRKILTVHARRPPIGAALSIGMRQNVFAVHLVLQGIEAKVSFTLRFRV